MRLLVKTPQIPVTDHFRNNSGSPTFVFCDQILTMPSAKTQYKCVLKYCVCRDAKAGDVPHTAGIGSSNSIYYLLPEASLHTDRLLRTKSPHRSAVSDLALLRTTWGVAYLTPTNINRSLPRFPSRGMVAPTRWCCTNSSSAKGPSV